MDTLTRIAEPVVQAQGLEIWGIEVLQGGRPTVRIYVDLPPAVMAAKHAARRAEQQAEMAQTAEELEAIALNSLSAESFSPESGSLESVSIDQCAKISRMVGLALEVDDVFPMAYVLEVSSPGLSRPFFRLEQMAPYTDETVEVVLNEALPDFQGRKKFRGLLQSVTDSDFTLLIEAGAEHDATALTLTWDQVRKAARVHVFLTPEKPGKKRKEEKK